MSDMDEAKAEAKRLLKLYDEASRRLNEAANEAARKFDKVMVSLSAGAFALSIAFLKAIAPVPVAKELLIAAWACFGLAITSISFAFLFSQYSAMKAHENWNRYIDDMATPQADPVPPSRATNRYSTITEVLNWVSICTFVLGLLCMVLFAVANFR